MNGIPLSREERLRIAFDLNGWIDARSPLALLTEELFLGDPVHRNWLTRVMHGNPPDLGLEVVHYCERAAWVDDPPLLVRLLRLLDGRDPSYPDLLARVEHQNPFRCHPPQGPWWACRLAMDLPFLGRDKLRAACAESERPDSATVRYPPAPRVVRINGPEKSGKTYTRALMQYLEQIRAQTHGLVYIDFAAHDLEARADAERKAVAQVLAEELHRQIAARRRAWYPPAHLAHLPPLYEGKYTTDNRTLRELVSLFVRDVIHPTYADPHEVWLLVFDNCERAPRMAKELVAHLVERAAGDGSDDAWSQAARCRMRLALLGESREMIPQPVDLARIVEEDLKERPGAKEILRFFRCLSECGNLNLGDELCELLTADTLAGISGIPTDHARYLPELAKVISDRTVRVRAFHAARAEVRNTAAGDA